MTTWAPWGKVLPRSSGKQYHNSLTGRAKGWMQGKVKLLSWSRRPWAVQRHCARWEQELHREAALLIQTAAYQCVSSISAWGQDPGCVDAENELQEKKRIETRYCNFFTLIYKDSKIAVYLFCPLSNYLFLGLSFYSSFLF